MFHIVVATYEARSCITFWPTIQETLSYIRLCLALYLNQIAHHKDNKHHLDGPGNIWQARRPL
jgi:hypothetical protein